jgi:hypothetical protein
MWPVPDTVTSGDTSSSFCIIGTKLLRYILFTEFFWLKWPTATPFWLCKSFFCAYAGVSAFLQEPWLAFLWLFPCSLLLASLLLLALLLLLAPLLLLADLLLLATSNFWHPFLLVLLFFDVADILHAAGIPSVESTVISVLTVVDALTVDTDEIEPSHGWDLA